MEKNSIKPHVLEEVEGDERLKTALSEVATSRQRIADLEVQLGTAQESMEKVKADAKKYVESLKKKEQVTNFARNSLWPRRGARLLALIYDFCF